MNVDETVLTISAHEDLKAELTPFGAGLLQLYFKGERMLYSGKQGTYFTANPLYYGQTISPFAGRIAKGRIGRFSFPVNEGPNCLHSSSFATSFKTFAYKIEERKEWTEVVFTHDQEVDGVRLHTEVAYRFHADAPRFSLRIGLTSSDFFPHNPTNHAYWNLGAYDISDLNVRFKSQRRVVIDEHKLPVCVRDCRDEFIGDRLILDKTLDYAYFLDEPMLFIQRGDVLLKVKTDAKAVNIFTGDSKLRPSLTLEFVNEPLLDENALKKGTSTVLTEYELEEL